MRPLIPLRRKGPIHEFHRKTNIFPLKINGWSRCISVFPIEIIPFLGDIRSFSGCSRCSCFFLLGAELPSIGLTYPFSQGMFEDDFPFSRGIC